MNNVTNIFDLVVQVLSNGKEIQQKVGSGKPTSCFHKTSWWGPCDQEAYVLPLYSMIQNTKNKPDNLYCVSIDKKSFAIKLEKSDYTILNI